MLISALKSGSSWTVSNVHLSVCVCVCVCVCVLDGVTVERPVGNVPTNFSHTLLFWIRATKAADI